MTTTPSDDILVIAETDDNVIATISSDATIPPDATISSDATMPSTTAALTINSVSDLYRSIYNTDITPQTYYSIYNYRHVRDNGYLTTTPVQPSTLLQPYIDTMTSDVEQEDVKVIVSQEEVDKLSYITYKELKETIKHGLMTECSICIDTFEENDDVLYTDCCHVFHKTCINKWLTKYNIKCPICKKDVAVGTPQL